MYEVPYRKISKHVKTRWNTFYEMIDIAYNYEKPITMMFNNHSAYSAHKLFGSDWNAVNALKQF